MSTFLASNTYHVHREVSVCLCAFVCIFLLCVGVCLLILNWYMLVTLRENAAFATTVFGVPPPPKHTQTQIHTDIRIHWQNHTWMRSLIVLVHLYDFAIAWVSSPTVTMNPISFDTSLYSIIVELRNAFYRACLMIVKFKMDTIVSTVPIAMIFACN